MLMISGDVLCHWTGGQFCTTSKRGKVGAIVSDDAGRLELFTVLVLLRPEFWRT